jgi:type II secretory pathway predicted ATPase ExeA
MEMSEGKMINLIFFGLPDLDEVLSLDEPLKQRVAVRVRLTALSEDDTRDYIIHRIKIAGSPISLISEQAISSIYKYSQGLPRLINTICDNALLEGFLIKAETIDEDIVQTAAIDLGLNDLGG